MKTIGLLGQIGFPAVCASVPEVRRWVRDLLNVAGQVDIDDLLLCVTELVANSVRHSDSARCPDGRVSVAVVHHDGTFHIDVIDAGSADRLPVLCLDVTVECGGGRGLWLVEQLSSAWGWYDIPDGRVVWFQIAGN